MANPISIQVLGVKESKKFLRSKNTKIKNQITKGMFKSAVLLQGEVKQSIAGRRAEHISVDTGRFLNSVDFKVKKDNAIVFSAVPYARRLEFGTNFRNSPRKHFRNSSARMKGPIIKLLNKEIKKI